MKTYFVTYKQNGIAKKGKIDESSYTRMSTDATIKELVIYPTELIMETNYQKIVCVDGSCNNRRILKG